MILLFNFLLSEKEITVDMDLIKNNYILIATGLVITFLGFYFNEEVFFGINSFSDSWFWYQIWGNTTQFGDGFFAALICVALIRKYPELTAQALFAFFFSLLLSQGGKEIFGGPRPLSFFGKELVNVIGPSLGHRSFPSGHTSTIFLLAVLLAKNNILNLRKDIWILLALTVGVSRVAVGAHFPRDVVGGMWVGMVAGGLGILMADKIPGYYDFWNKKSTWIFFYIASIVAVPFMFINFKPYNYFPTFYILFALVIVINAIVNLRIIGRKKINLQDMKKL